jgi:hypothetical protein
VLSAAGFGAVGVGLLIWAATDAAFRNQEGILLGQICLPVGLTFAFWILAATFWNFRWRRAGFWAAVVVASQAVSLQMIDAGNWAHFQHYPSASKLLRYFLWHVAFLSVQAGVVLISLRPANLWDWLTRRYRLWALGAILLALAFTSANLSRKPADYGFEIVFSTVVQLVNLGSILMVARSLPESSMAAIGSRIEALLGDDKIRPLRLERLVCMGALWVVVVAAFLAYFVYQNHPHVPDEVIYMFHARYLAEGRLFIEAPPVPEAFAVYLASMENGRLYASPPAAWAAVLALGYRVGLPWLVNPILGGLNIILAFLLFRRVVGARYARLAVVLLCCSPWFVLMCMNFMMHTLTLCCVLIAALGILRAGESGQARWAWMAGVATGYTSLIRPLDGLLLAGILGLWSLGLGGRRLRFSGLAGLVLGTVLVGALALPYNQYFTGSPTRFPLNEYLNKYFGPGRNDLGFGPNKGLPFGDGMDAFPGHGIRDVIANGLLNSVSLNTELHGWACGSLAAILLLIFSGRMSRRDQWMLGAIAATFVGFSTYWFSGGPDFGARYWYLMLVPLLMLTLSGIQYLERETGQRIRVLATVFVLCGGVVVNYMPWRAIGKYVHYRGMRPDIRQIAVDYKFGKDLVLIRGLRHPDYASAWIYNPLRWDSDEPVYASLENPALREDLVRAFPGRRIWILEGPTLTKAGYRVSGPLTAKQLLEMEFPN